MVNIVIINKYERSKINKSTIQEAVIFHLGKQCNYDFIFPARIYANTDAF